MTTRIVLGLVMALGTSMATNATPTRTTWVAGLPIIEDMKSEVGVWNFVWGSALILAAPGKFPGYWPDYGYRWSTSTYLELCRGPGHGQSVKDPYLGRVRMVAETPERTGHLIGIELQLEEHVDVIPAAGASRTSKDRPGLTLNQLCELLHDDVARIHIEAVVRAMATNPADILTSGTWDDAGISMAENGVSVIDHEYILLWKGLGSDRRTTSDHDVKWSVAQRPEEVVVWKHPKHVQLRGPELLEGTGWIGYSTGAGIDMEVVAAGKMDMDRAVHAPSYILTKIAGISDSPGEQKSTSFEVRDGGIVDMSFLSAANVRAEDLTKATTFAVWSKIARYTESGSNISVWLVTENAIRQGSLIPDIRASGGG